VGQLAWIVEKFHDWNKAVQTPEDEVGRDRLLTNATLYWLIGTATSSAQFYYESAAHLGKIFTPGVAPEPVTVPIGVAVFGQDPGLPRFGFEPGAAHGFRKPSLRIPDAAFQVLRLPTYESWMTGTLVYAEAFWRQDAVGRRDPKA
jgi:hypothetical protein